MDMPPMKKKQTVASKAAARGPLPELPKPLLNQLVKGPMTPAEVPDLMLAFNKTVIERAMGAEMNLHLATCRASPSRLGRPTSATAPAAKRSSPIAARSGATSPAIATAASSRS